MAEVAEVESRATLMGFPAARLGAPAHPAALASRRPRPVVAQQEDSMPSCPKCATRPEP